MRKYNTTVPLFDIDLTLVENIGSRWQSFEHAIKKVFGVDVSAKDFATHGMIDPEILMELLKFHGHDHVTVTKEQRGTYLSEMESYFFTKGILEVSYKPMPGAYEALQYLTENNYMIGILTGNTEKIARYKLKQVNLDSYLNFGLFGDSVDRRAELSDQAKSKVLEYFPPSIKPKLVVIGDSPRDVYAAHEANLPAIGIGAGKYSVKELIEAGADATIESLENKEELVTLLEKV